MSREPAPPLPRGLVLFPASMSRQRRRVRLAFAVVLAAASAALVWPVFAWLAGPRPFILGLPLPLAWSVLWLAVVFGGLLALYRVDRGAEAGREDG